MKIDIEERTLHFKQPAGTSRGVYLTRRSHFIHLTGDDGKVGIGECAPLPNLSCDDIQDYAAVLKSVCDKYVREGEIDYIGLRRFPSMLFGLETAVLNQRNGLRLFDTAFSRGETGITINGLVWMGSYEEMLARMEEKMAMGFRCIKLKIGAIDFDHELDLIKRIRGRFSRKDIELRVDANGGFSFAEAPRRLEQLAEYDLHSIEQPIKAGRWDDMAELCASSPLPIALDEELIGLNSPEEKRAMLSTVRPAYIVLKPSLHGGMRGCEEWIALAREMNIGSWITSALESNIGLNAVAQFASKVYGDSISMPQGLGTGQLFTDNISMPLVVKGDQLWLEN